MKNIFKIIICTVIIAGLLFAGIYKRDENNFPRINPVDPGSDAYQGFETVDADGDGEGDYIIKINNDAGNTGDRPVTISLEGPQADYVYIGTNAAMQDAVQYDYAASLLYVLTGAEGTTNWLFFSFQFTSSGDRSVLYSNCIYLEPSTNRAPAISSLSASTTNAHIFDTVTLTTLASDPDSDPITYTYSCPTPGAYLSSSNNFIADITFSNTGVFDVTVYVGDSNFTVSSNIVIYVTNVSPVISSFTPATYTPHIGDPVTLTTAATDPDGDPLSYSYFCSSPFAYYLSSNASVINMVFSNIDVYEIFVYVSDGEISVTNSLFITNTNYAPNISGVSPSIAYPRPTDVFTLDVTASDPDGDSITYNYTCPSPEAYIVSNGTPIAYVIFSNTGSYAVTIEVSDGLLTTSLITNLICTNSDPVISEIYASNDNVSSRAVIMKTSKSINIVVDANDAELDGITYSYNVSDGGGYITGSGSSVTYTSTNVHTNVIIGVSVMDVYGGSNFSTIDLEVKDYQKISDFFGGFPYDLETAEYFGQSAVNVGDLNGDGIDELAVGSALENGGADQGAVYIMFMSNDRNVSNVVRIAGGQSGFSGSIPDYSYFGYSLAPLGDLNGDGVPDLAAGAYYDEGAGGAFSGRGAFYVLMLNSDGTVKSYTKITEGSNGFTNTLDNNDYFGYSLANVGDYNNDGKADLAIGAVGDDDSHTAENNTGAIYICFMETNGTVLSNQKISDTQGTFGGSIADGDEFGSSIASIGDLNNDGVNDLAIGAWRSDIGGTDRGSVWILMMNSNGTCAGFTEINDQYGNFSGILADFDYFGYSVCGIGDFNGDTAEDIAVGSAGAAEGAAWLIYLNTAGNCVGWTNISASAGGLSGVFDNGDNLGSAVYSLGDVNKDGVIDLMVGAALDDDGVENDAGAVYQFFLSPNGSVKE